MNLRHTNLDVGIRNCAYIYITFLAFTHIFAAHLATMTGTKTYRCEHCNHKCKSLRGLTQHWNKSAKCVRKRTAKRCKHNDAASLHYSDTTLPPGWDMLSRNMLSSKAAFLAKSMRYRRKTSTLSPANLHTKGMSTTEEVEIMDDSDDSEQSGQEDDTIEDQDDDMNTAFGDDEEADGNANIVNGQVEHGQDDPPVEGNPNTEIRRDFQEYVAYAQQNYWKFAKGERNAINLLSILRDKKGSLDTYDAVYEWHLKITGDLVEGQSLGKNASFYSRKSVYKRLEKRYNMEGFGHITKITLPYSRMIVDVVWNDFCKVAQHMLADPRIQAKDYLFFDDNPFAPPPENINVIGDLNTGKSYTETWKALITKPNKQVLLPVIFYMDGAVTGQFAQLPITAVRIAFGILNRKARDKDQNWGTLGYIPSLRYEQNKGLHLTLASGHREGQMMHPNEAYDDVTPPIFGNIGVNHAKINKAQDKHTILHTILTKSGYIDVQNSGFIWDLCYNGKVYKDVEFILFTPFIKCDTEEADKLCGKYAARTPKVQHLCRYCHCPNRQTNAIHREYPYKTKAEIEALVESENYVGLKAISQHYVQNGMYGLRFGQHNDHGIHGATPSEMLHALLLGLFKYIRDCFFQQIKPESARAERLNGLCIEYGRFLRRQSDRDFPKTKFAQGITKGKLMANEYRGVLLCLACAIKSTKGRGLVMEQLGGNEAHTDWLLLLETLLEWEQWLRSPEMRVYYVKRAKRKHKYVMYLIKKVGKRTEGMGLRIMKYHAILHICEDIINFGVPLEVDTGSNESGHKATKRAAQLTQKNEETFDEQTALRLKEVMLLNLAKEEMKGFAFWNYYNRHQNNATVTENEGESAPSIGSTVPTNMTGGAEFDCWYKKENIEHPPVFKPLSKFKGNDDCILENTFVKFAADLKMIVKNYGIRNMLVRSQHQRNGIMFRGHVKYHKHIWRDWVMVNWGDDGHIPAKIWGFVDLKGLAPDSGINYGGLLNLQPTTYAIIESSKEQVDQDEDYSIFTPFSLELDAVVQRPGGGVVICPKFYLADVETFVAPICCIPDIGGPHDAYFLVDNQRSWCTNFLRWLNLPHEPLYDDLEEGSDA